MANFVRSFTEWVAEGVGPTLMTSIQTHMDACLTSLSVIFIYLSLRIWRQIEHQEGVGDQHL